MAERELQEQLPEQTEPESPAAGNVFKKKQGTASENDPQEQDVIEQSQRASWASAEGAGHEGAAGNHEGKSTAQGKASEITQPIIDENSDTSQLAGKKPSTEEKKTQGLLDSKEKKQSTANENALPEQNTLFNTQLSDLINQGADLD